MAGGETLTAVTTNFQLPMPSPPGRDPISLPALAGFIVDAYDVIVVYSASVIPADWTIELDNSSNAKIEDLPPGDPNFLDGFIPYAQDQTAGLAGGSGGGQNVSLLFTHTGSGAVAGGSSVPFAQVIATGHGSNPPPFPASATFLSAVRATPNATMLTNLAIDSELGGGSIVVHVSTGPDADHLGDPVLVTPGPIALAAGAVVQYELELAGDGWHAPAVERVEIDYATAAPRDSR